MSNSNQNNTTNYLQNNLYLILCAIFITNAILAEIIGTKIFSLESIFNLPPAQIKFSESFPSLDFNLTAGVLIWPIVFVTTDLINEYFGKNAVRKISLVTAILIAYVFIIIWVSTTLPPAQFWLKVNSLDIAGNAININSAFSTIFRQGAGIIVGSIFAFLVGQLIDAHVFHFIKSITKGKWIWMRATGSTLVSQLIDSYLVLFVAFYLLGGKQQWPLATVFAVGTLNYIYKFFVAILLTPLLYVLHKYFDKILNR